MPKCSAVNCENEAKQMAHVGLPSDGPSYYLTAVCIGNGHNPGGSQEFSRKIDLREGTIVFGIREHSCFKLIFPELSQEEKDERDKGLQRFNELVKEINSLSVSPVIGMCVLKGPALGEFMLSSDRTFYHVIGSSARDSTNIKQHPSPASTRIHASFGDIKIWAIKYISHLWEDDQEILGSADKDLKANESGNEAVEDVRQLLESSAPFETPKKAGGSAKIEPN